MSKMSVKTTNVNEWMKWCEEHYGIEITSTTWAWEGIYNGQFFEAPTKIELLRKIAQTTDVITYTKYLEDYE
jgi:hypothetical protein